MRALHFLPLAILLAALGGCRRTERASPDASSLAGLPYITSTAVAPAERKLSGVTVHDRSRAARGLNLVTSWGGHGAQLLDMDGGVVHEWTHPQLPGHWNFAELDAAGNLYVVYRDIWLVKLDRDSKLIWRTRDYVHHDIQLLPDGGGWALSGRPRRVPGSGGTGDVILLDDHIVRFDASGRITRRISVYDMLRDVIPVEDLEQARAATATLAPDIVLRGFEAVGKAPPGTQVVEPGSVFDLFHINSVELIERDLPGVAQRGNLLVSFRNLDLIAIVDVDAERVVWSWGPGELEEQHHASLQPDGTIMVFDNGVRRLRSRIVRVDPATGKIVWRYEAPAGASFFSRRKGSAEAMANGNVLVAESDAGRLFEVTTDGAMVWEYYNPVTITKKGETRRGAIYRVHRGPVPFLASSHQPDSSP